MPETLIYLSELRGRLIRFTEESAEHTRIANDLLFGIENSFKAYRGEEKALVDPALITAKRAADADLKAQVAKNAALAADIGDPWSDIAKAQADYHALYLPYGMMETPRRLRLRPVPLRPHPGARGGRKKPSPMASGCRNIPTAGWRC